MQCMAIVALAFLHIIIDEATADPDSDLELAHRFSPILILTEDTDGLYPVMRPEPVQIVGADSARSLRFEIVGEDETGLFDSYTITYFNEPIESLENWTPPLVFPDVSFSMNRFAFLQRLYRHNARASLPESPPETLEYTIRPFFDYPGDDPTTWRNTYEGMGPRAGRHFKNTAYVRVFDRDGWAGHRSDVTVLKYFYFYPYNAWKNNHEGDWPRVHVVVSSREADNATVLGVEYLAHGVHVSYYKDYAEKIEIPSGVGGGGATLLVSAPDITSEFSFDPRREIRLAQDTHPIIYVGAGSHGSYPTGGSYRFFDKDITFKGIRIGYQIYKRVTHTGVVLRTQIDNSTPSCRKKL